MEILTPSRVIEETTMWSTRQGVLHSVQAYVHKWAVNVCRVFVRSIRRWLYMHSRSSGCMSLGNAIGRGSWVVRVDNQVPDGAGIEELAVCTTWHNPYTCNHGSPPNTLHW
jgi:hypothetical protein